MGFCMKQIGFENGIYVKRKNNNIKSPIWINNWGFKDEQRIDICYWFNEFNFRNELKSFLLINEKGETNLSLFDLEKILIILKKTNKHMWIDEGWEWKTIKPMVRYSKKALKWAIKQKKKYKDDIEFIFYDSF